MKKLVLFIAIAAVAGAGAAGAIAHPQAVAKRHVTKVTVVMHDPGCHWFSVGGKLEKTQAVAGPASLLNLDEAAVKIVGPKGTEFVKVGKTITLGKGVYKIAMVGQAPDDNHLKLTVR